MVRHNLQSDPPDKSNIHLVLYIVVTVLLTVFPVLYFTSPWLFCNCHSVLLNPFFTKQPKPFPSCNHEFFLYIYEFVSALPVYLFCILDYTYKWNYMVFIFFCLNYFTLHNAFKVHPCCSKRFYSFSWLSNISLYICTTPFLIQLSINGHLDCFHILAIVYEMSFVPFYSLSFKVYFAWYKYCYPRFFSFHFLLHEISLSIQLFSVCASSDLKWVSCVQHM